MNSRTLRRLAVDHRALRDRPLPPNYLFAPGHASDDLAALDVLLAGPAHTPFASGVWKLHLAMPPTYPAAPPTAHFRTPIFHPNVDPASGAVCVETLKRDWAPRLTLRDVLLTIACLLIHPNPDSALNADAAALLQEDYAAFAHRAEMLAGIQAKVPRALAAAVEEAQSRGNRDEANGEMAAGNASEADEEEHAPARRRRTIARVRAKARRDDRSPSETDVLSRLQLRDDAAPVPGQHPARGKARKDDASPSEAVLTSGRPVADDVSSVDSQRPFVFQAGEDDLFDIAGTLQTTAQTKPGEGEDNSMTDADQENDALRSPHKASTPRLAATPRRPHGTPIPLGELILEEDIELDTSEDMEPEYPPSPRKSPRKSPERTQQTLPAQYSESSRNAALRAPNITPPNDTDKPLAEGSPFACSMTSSASPRKPQSISRSSPLRAEKTISRSLFETRTTNPKTPCAVTKPRYPSSAEQKRDEQRRHAMLSAKLWELCGQDIKRWNVGDFDGAPFKLKAARW